jgi:hypothetical protein
LSVIRPRDYRRRRLIEDALRDLSPDVRDEARRLLESLDYSVLSDREAVRRLLRRRGFLH